MYFPKWSPNNKLIAGHTASDGGHLKVFDTTTGATIREITGNSNDSFAWSPDGNRLLVTQENAVVIYDFKKDLEMKIQTPQCECNFKHACWSPDGQSIASSVAMKHDQNRTVLIRVWNAESGVAVAELKVKGRVRELSWSPDGHYLLYSELGSITLIDAKNYAKLRSITTNGCVAFSWSPAKKQLLFSDSGCVHVLNAKTFRETIKVKIPGYEYFSFSLSPDERLLQLSGKDTLAICDAKTGKYLGFKTVQDTYGSHWTPDGKAVVIRRLHLAPHIEQVSLPQYGKNATVFTDGLNGSPGWENDPSPHNLKECFNEFDKRLSKEARARFKNVAEDRVCDFGGGSLILDVLMADVYDTWGLVNLKTFFERYGITDPKDVFGIVLDSYWRHLNSKPLRLGEQVRKQKAWWDLAKPVVAVRRQMPRSLLELKAEDSHSRPFSIGSLKGKLKIVSLIDTKSQFSARIISSLKDLRARYPSKDLSFVVFVVPPEFLTEQHWPANKTVTHNEGETKAKEIAAFQSSTHDGIIVAPASEALINAMFQFLDISRYQSFYPPQTLVLTGKGLVKTRLDGSQIEATVCGLESEIKAANMEEQ